MPSFATTNLLPALALASGIALALPSAALARGLPAEEAAVKGAKVLAPIAGWQLEAAQDRCRLSRKFGPENSPSVLLLEQIAPGPRFDLTVAGPDVSQLTRPGDWIYGGLRSDAKLRTIDLLPGAMPEFGGSLNMVEVSIADDAEAKQQLIEPAIDLADASQVERIVFRQRSNIVSLETGNMRAALEAFNVCTKDLIPMWGLSLEAHAQYKPPQMPGGNTFFSSLRHDFAKESGAKGHQALLRVRAMIAKDGSVTDCHFEYPLSTGGEQADVCHDIREMKFDAAEDVMGNAMASFFVKSVFLTPYSPRKADAHGGRQN